MGDLALHSAMYVRLETKKKTRVFPVHWPTAMPCWWAPVRARQLSMAATARVMWLCACVRYWSGRGLVCVCQLFQVCTIFKVSSANLWTNTKYITSSICSIIKFIYLHIFFSSSWRKIVTHLAWSLLDLSDGLTPLKSADSFSETIALLLYAGYLVLALILLINMLIALLSNTYQRVQVRIQLLKEHFSCLVNQSN